MRIVIISDIHGNIEALKAVTVPCDELWVLGDLVNYGPNPSEVVELVRRKASLVIRGNHDHAIGFGRDPHCSAAFREMSREMQVYSESVLNDDQKAFLRELPLTAQRVVNGHRFLLCHAVPSDPLFRYCPSDSPAWSVEAAQTDTDILLMGHTHLPFQTTVGGRQIVNLGSVGQPKHGLPLACYALWEDGRLSLKSRPYQAKKTAGKVRALPIGERIASQLADVLTRGALQP